ncbi:MAG: hypothetical protein K2X93_14380 [Candidatus Obscuribacterales bacterium]|nr:hypothetical protein [Candidatus Obscuribacterales bacterium]
MEMLIYLKSLGRYLSESPEHIREELANELRERLHRKERGCWTTQFTNMPEDSDEGASRLARLIVRDPDAPASLLARLAISLDKEVLERIAEHPRVSSHTLTALADSEHVEVRQAVVDNANTPYTILVAMCQDEDVDVRYRIAENPNVSIKILRRLEDDENPYVAIRARTTIEKVCAEYASEAA